MILTVKNQESVLMSPDGVCTHLTSCYYSIRSAPSSPTHHAGMASHDYSIGRDSPQPHTSRMVMLPATYSLPSSPSRNHRPLKFTHLTLGASTGSLQRVDTGEDAPASKKLCLDSSAVPSEDNIHHARPGKLFGTSSTALLTAMHRSMATRETPTMPNVNLGSKLKDIQQQPVTNNGSLKSSPAAVQMVPISLVSSNQSNQGHVYVNIPSGVFSQSQQPSVTAIMSTQGLLAPQAFIPMANIQEVSNGSHDADKESCDDEIPSEEQECDHTTSHDATVQSPEALNGSPDASVGSPDHDALPGSPDPAANAD